MKKIINKRRPEVDFKKMVGTDNEFMIEEIKEIEHARHTILPNWDYVDFLLSCFDNTDNWHIDELSNGMFVVLPDNASTYEKNLYYNILVE